MNSQFVVTIISFKTFSSIHNKEYIEQECMTH